MAFDAQKQIRENTLELQEFLKDLKQWETRVKEKDKKLKSQTQDDVSGIPSIRGHRESSTLIRSRREPSHTQPSKGGTQTVPRVQPAAKSKGIHQEESTSSMVANHTYDHYHDKWDRFDVEAALREVDGEDTSVFPTHQEEKKKNKVQPDSESRNHTGGTWQAAPGFMPLPHADQNPAPKLGNMGSFSSAFKSSSSESFSDATSEKELGNKYFKEKKFVQAIECYSRSIALQPSAVAHANRAMAYIKIRRFKEAESDCTEAVALDDRYVKAFSRRGMARKELGNYVGAVEDAEFALRLEPENKELKEQYLEAKAMCEKTTGGKHKEKKLPLSIEEIRTRVTIKPENRSEDTTGNNDQKVVLPKQGSGLHVANNSIQPVQQVLTEQSVEKNTTALASVQAAAAFAAAARVAAHTVIAAPKTFYEFEAAWKSLSSNGAQQAELLKVMKPSSLPNLFKDNLSPKLLAEIIRCLEHLFPDNAGHAIEILENLTKARRFSMTVMCLTSKEKAELRKLWENVFVGDQLESEKIETLSGLRSKYQL